jgi:hypothetical protein
VILKLFSKDLKVCLKLPSLKFQIPAVRFQIIRNVFMLSAHISNNPSLCFSARQNPTLALQICQEDYLPEALDLHN